MTSENLRLAFRWAESALPPGYVAKRVTLPDTARSVTDYVRSRYGDAEATVQTDGVGAADVSDFEDSTDYTIKNCNGGRDSDQHHSLTLD